MIDYAVTFRADSCRITFLVADLDAVCAVCQALDHLEAKHPEIGKHSALGIDVAVFRGQQFPAHFDLIDHRSTPNIAFMLPPPAQEAA